MRGRGIDAHITDIDRWAGPFAPDMQREALAALEDGRVLYCPRLAFDIAPEWRPLLDPASASGSAKNISLDPATGELRGTAVTGAERALLQAMMQRFAAAATELVRGLFPGYGDAVARARTSFRPVEIAGRAYSPRKDDRLLHVDAFPSTPMRGRRILRFFSNISPENETRIWHVGEPFAAAATRFLPAVGRPTPPTASWLLSALRITRGRRSPYDQLMLRLHDAIKADASYQTNASEIAFPAGTSWLCFTDQVLHAALSGRCALEQTFYVDVAAMAEPAKSPLAALERLTGRALR